MSNVDSQLGLRPLKSKYGTVPQVGWYTRSVTGVLYEGQIVYQSEVGPRAYNGTTADTENSIIGVTAAYCKASDTEIPVYDDIEQLYEVQADGNAISTSTLVLISTGRYCNLVSLTDGNTLTGQSKIELDTSEVTSVRAEHDVVQLVGLSSDPNNDYTSANEKWVVKLAHNVGLFVNNRTVVNITATG
jgi:hypothetical protein